MDRTNAKIEARALRAGADWHLAWAAVLGLAAIAWPAADPDLRLRGAFAAAAAPGLVGQLLRLGPGPVPRAVLALAWAAGVGAAISLTGGFGGPLACLAIAPAAALASCSDRRLLAFGAALALAAVAAVGLATGLGVLAPPPAAPPWLPLAAVAATLAGLAVSFQLVGARGSEQLRASAEEATALRRLLEAGPMRALRLGADGVVRQAFEAAPDEGAPGQSFVALADERDQAALGSALEIVLRTGAASVGFAPPHALDRFFAAELRALPGGDVAAFVRDASYERGYEAFLEQRRADAEEEALAKSRFLANMSHELRTPLNAIIGFSDIMRSRMFGPIVGRYAEYVGLIHESGGHLLDLINDILDMSKIEADRFTLSREQFDAREAVAAALRLSRVQADSLRVDLRAALPSGPLGVDADRRALKQIVLNLVSNALKFTPPGGQVNMVARALGADLELIVADTGVGIAPADLARLGRPYEQAGGAEQRSLGTGLGLSLVRALAELHGGVMTIRSVLGEGTVVTVTLPVVEAAPSDEGAATQPSGRPAPARSATRGDNVIVFNPHR